MVDFHKNTKIELKCNTWKKDKFYLFYKIQKLKSFTWKIN